MNLLLVSVAIVFEVLTQSGRTWATHQLIGEPPRFAGQQPNVTVFETDVNGNRMNLELACNITNPSGGVSYAWYRGNDPLPQDMVDQASGRLTVVNITEGEFASKEGVTYYCVANKTIGMDNHLAAVRSRTITVFYAFFEGFEQTVMREMPVSVATGSNVALECDVLPANPPPQIEWLRNGAVIADSNAVRFLDGGRYLFIATVESSDLMPTTYSCRVNNTLLYQTVNAPTTYTLVANLSEPLVDYKQIGDLMAFVGDQNFEFAYVGGSVNGRTRNILSIRPVGRPESENVEVSVVTNIGRIPMITEVGTLILTADVDFGPTENVIRTGTLTVYQKPLITRSPVDMREVFEGSGALRFTCESVGSPAPNITWYVNGQPINPISGVSTVGNTLTIASPLVSNSGVYQCIVSNRFGDDQRAWLLEIRKTVKATVMPYNLTALDAFDDRDLGALIVRDNGSEVTFMFDVEADPCPSITWSFNGTRLGPPNATFVYNDPCSQGGVMSRNWRFTLQVPVLTADTSGAYSANLTNMAGTTVLPKAYITVPAPVTISEVMLTKPCLKEGTDVSVRCVVEGFPRPTITFSFNDNPVVPRAGSSNNVIVREFYDQIGILNVNMSAGGRYTCTATGEAVQDQSGRVSRTEIFNFCTLPIIDSILPTPNPVIGEEFSIDCTVDGIPLPDVSWQFNERTLKNSDNLRIVETDNRRISSVEVTDATSKFNGIYTCIATNNAGTVNKSVRIELQPSSELPLPLNAIIGIAAGGVALILMIAFVILLLVCVYTCAKKTTGGNYSANPAHMGTDYHDGRGNVDKDSDEEDGQPEAFNPEYESLPALRPSQPPSYKPTPSYPMGMDDMEMRKVPLPDSDSYLGGGRYIMQDNGSAPYNRPVVDDFLSEDAQFV